MCHWTIKWMMAAGHDICSNWWDILFHVLDMPQIIRKYGSGGGDATRWTIELNVVRSYTLQFGHTISISMHRPTTFYRQPD